jgi:hypothetical protein
MCRDPLGRFGAALDFEVAFLDVERFVFSAVDVHCAVVLRDHSFS